MCSNSEITNSVKMPGSGFQNSAIFGKLLREEQFVMFLLYSSPLDSFHTCERQVIQLEFQRDFPALIHQGAAHKGLWSEFITCQLGSMSLRQMVVSWLANVR